MARQSEGAWYRSGKDAWYATISGKKIALGVKGKQNKKAAKEAWYRLSAMPKPSPKAHDFSVSTLVERYLADSKTRISPEAHRGYCKFLKPFADAYGSRQAEALTAQEAEAFARSRQWSPTYQAGFLGTLSGAYRWAVRERFIAINPMNSVRKPIRKSRGTEAILSPDDHTRLIAKAKPDMKDFLILLWQTGARPSEIAGLQAEQVLASDNGIIPLVKHKNAHHGKARFLIVQGEAWDMIKRRAKAVGSGLLFGQLTANAIGQRLRKLCRKAGVKHCIAYGYRHSYATQALAKGVPDATVAALLGHSGTAMLHRHYSHLTAQTQVLRQAAAQVRA
jgi:integrase